eukprot:364507-Chlamydomonas_euryale.AAC.8
MSNTTVAPPAVPTAKKCPLGDAATAEIGPSFSRTHTSEPTLASPRKKGLGWVRGNWGVDFGVWGWGRLGFGAVWGGKAVRVRGALGLGRTKCGFQAASVWVLVEARAV